MDFNIEVQYKHIVLGNHVENDYIKARNLVISYVSYAIYKHWILSENNIVNFHTTSLLHFIKKDLMSRTIYVKEKMFLNICDKIIVNL